MNSTLENTENGLELQSPLHPDDALSWESLIGGMEGMISEAWHSAWHNDLPRQRNLFGRQISLSRSGADPIAFLSGFLLSGLRAAALLTETEAWKHHSALTAAPARLSNWVLYLQQSEDASAQTLRIQNAAQSLLNCGIFQWSAGSPQEVLDFGLIAHRTAELALLPGMVLLESSLPDASTLEELMPGPEALKHYLGDPDSRVEAPTPAQRILFGETRRRLPNRFSFDEPAVEGGIHDPTSAALAVAARGPFFFDHLEELSQQALDEFSKSFFRSYQCIEENDVQNAEHLIVMHGEVPDSLKKELAERREQRVKIGILRLLRLRPFPGAELASKLTGKKTVTVLEKAASPIAPDPPLLSDISSALSRAEENGRLGRPFHPEYPLLPAVHRPILLGATCISGPSNLSREEAKAICVNMQLPEPSKSFFFDSRLESDPSPHGRFMIGPNFTGTDSAFPKIEAEWSSLKEDYSGLDDHKLPSLPSSRDKRSRNSDKIRKGTETTELPLAARLYRDGGAPYTQLSRFHNQTVDLYRSDMEMEQTASPFQSIPAVPVATAGLQPYREGDLLPVLDPERCSGCGECFLHCPHSAIPPAVFSPETLLQSAAEVASTQGRPLAQLVPALRGLGQTLGKVVRDHEESSLSLEKLLPAAFEILLGQMKPEGEKLKAMQKEFESLQENLKDYPVSRTAPFFDKAEAQKRGSGELFSLHPDPQLCTGCGICAQKCPEEALQMKEPLPEVRERLQRNFRFWETLPDPSEATLKRVLQDKEYPSLAAVLLSRHYSMSLRGGRAEAQGIAEQGLLHLVTAVAESLCQPAFAALAKEAENLREQLKEALRKQLGEALPPSHYEALAKTLSEEEGSRLPFITLLQSVSGEQSSELVDLVSLRSKLELDKELHGLQWALEEGPGGVGRSRIGMLLAGNKTLQWSRTYPYFPFAFPTILEEDGEQLELTLGLIEGQQRHHLDNIRLLRRAALEARGSYQASRDDLVIASLGWEELTDEERCAFPPLLVVLTHESLTQNGTETLRLLLASKMPLKVVLFDSLPPHEADPEHAASMLTGPVLEAMLDRQAFVLQSSLATPEHLYGGLVEGLRRPGPALFHLHATHPGEDPQEALASRVFPTIRFDPEGKGIFGLLLDLSDNPEPSILSDVSEEELPETDVSSETFAEWAFQRESFKGHFHAFQDEGAPSLELSDYLDLEAGEQQARVPFICVSDEGETVRYGMSGKMIRASVLIHEHWKMLLELSGAVTPFTEKLRDELKQELADAHQNEVEELRQDYEERMQQQEQEWLAQTRLKIRKNLVELSLRQHTPAENGQGLQA